MVDLRRIALIFVIAVLYAVLVNSIIGAVYPEPQYEDYCKKYYPEKPYIQAEESSLKCPAYKEPSIEELEECAEQKGFPDYRRDGKGCIIEYKGCNFCQRDYDKASQKHNFVAFILSSILAVLAIVIAFMLPVKNSLNEWIATGFILGGLISLFFGTIMYYQYLGRYIKPVVILIELLIVVYLAYKKLQDFAKK